MGRGVLGDAGFRSRVSAQVFVGDAGLGVEGGTVKIRHRRRSVIGSGGYNTAGCGRLNGKAFLAGRLLPVPDAQKWLTRKTPRP